MAALVADHLTGHPAHPVLLTTMAAVALTLDVVDGPVARRTGQATALGARFDMEADAVLMTVLSVHLASLYGWWILGIGALRYVFVAASRPLPWLAGALPRRPSRRLVAAITSIVLVVAQLAAAPRPDCGRPSGDLPGRSRGLFHARHRLAGCAQTCHR